MSGDRWQETIEQRELLCLNLRFPVRVTNDQMVYQEPHKQTTLWHEFRESNFPKDKTTAVAKGLFAFSHLLDSARGWPKTNPDSDWRERRGLVLIWTLGPPLSLLQLWIPEPVPGSKTCGTKADCQAQMKRIGGAESTRIPLRTSQLTLLLCPLNGSKQKQSVSRLEKYTKELKSISFTIGWPAVERTLRG